MLTDREIVSLFEEYHPKTVEEIEALGLTPEFVNSGTSRSVYRLGGLAVKIEGRGNYQTTSEIKCIKRIHQDPSLEHLHPHVAPLYYENELAGVIVTKYYSQEGPRANDNPKVSKLRASLQMIGVTDLWTGNFRQDEIGRLVAIDLGYYREPE